jgi:branched-chain amino acid transport system ATP-binding protein
MAAIIRLEHVAKRFGALVAMDDLSLQLEEREALGVIGPNGAGKTTMFNIVTGSVRADRGSIFFEGREITHLRSFERCRRGISRSFQIPCPFAGMTVFENLLVGATFGDNKREREAYAACLEVLETTGLLAKANVKAGSLTLLDRKRLELARALATRPKVLLLDEIAGGLTEQECDELVRQIAEIRATGISIIWIEHIVHALMALVDRLVVMNFGRKIDDGDPRTVMESAAVREIYLGEEGDAI